MATGEPNEQTPINPNEGDNVDNVEEIGPNGSVYNAILFLPSYHLHKSGTLKVWEVFLLCVIFTTCVVLQGGLTFLTGRDILVSYSDWVGGLVFNVQKVDFWEATKVESVDYKSKNIRGQNVGEVADCCSGSECFALGRQCCQPLARNATQEARTALVAHRHSQQHLLLEDDQSSISLDAVFGDSRKKARQRAAALCIRDGPTLNCAPRTMDFVHRWHDLDFDGDGVWTLQEAKEDPANLGCELGVPAEDVFRRASRGLEKDARDTARLTGLASKLPTEVASSKAIPHGWFIWWTGIVGICVNTDSNLCGELVASGLFDEAMNPSHHGSRGAVTNLDSAMEYCGRLVSDGGICDSSLPVSYGLYRARVDEKCGKAAFSRGPRHSNPFNEDDVQGTVKIEYAMHAEYSGTRSKTFLMFLCFILFLWYAALIDELKGILQIWDFVGNFPVNDGISKGDSVSDLDGGFEIRRISRAHYRMCMGMAIVRSLMFFYMAYVGTIFLLSNHTFLDLLMNSVALAFIFELDEFIYSILVSEEEQREHEGAQPLRFPSWFPHTGNSAKFYKKGNWGLTLIPGICVGIALWNDWSSTLPIVEALECACFHQGNACLDSQTFTPDWWKWYWSETAWLASGSK